MDETPSSERAERLQRLFDAILDLKPDERKGYLDKHCGDDPALRIEIEALYQAYIDRASDVQQAFDLHPFAPTDEGQGVLHVQAGQTVSHYRILEHLGEGGMGVVFKALDTHLDRIVALKFLPPHLGTDRDARTRFIQEAKAASALDHTNICTIFDIDEIPDSSGTGSSCQLFISMSCYEGESLRDKIERGLLSIEEALDYAVQMSRGLFKAHKRGIIHRDIKPANVMVTEEGVVKIVDFGLAKMVEMSLTKTGRTLGTAKYMSPEQARGERVDARTDIWSLGVMLYEMLTGQPPFQGDYEAAVLYQVVNEKPVSIRQLRPEVPGSIVTMIEKLLQKDLTARYESMEVLLADLEVIVDVLVTKPHDRHSAIKPPGEKSVEQHERDRARLREVDLVPTPVSSPIPGSLQSQRRLRWQQVLPWFLAGLMMVAAAVAYWMVTNMREELGQPRAYGVPLSLGQRLVGSYTSPIALSPTENVLVYAASHEGHTQLYLRPLDQIEATPIPGTEGAATPFFSPDGRWVGFIANFQLKKVQISGGIPQTICDASYMSAGASWGTDNTIVFTTAVSGLLRVSASGGEPEPLTIRDTDRGESHHAFPQFLPGNRDLLYSIKSREQWNLAVLSLDTRTSNLLPLEGSNARYLPSGHLVYGHSGNLWAVPFDREQLAPTGAPVIVHTDVYRTEENYFEVTPTGTLAYVPDIVGGENLLVWVDLNGNDRPMTEQRGFYTHPRFSFNGEHLAVVIRGEQNRSDVWILDIESGRFERLTSEGNNIFPVWTKDDRYVIFTSDRNGIQNLYWKRSDGGGATDRLLLSEDGHFSMSWWPGGQQLAYITNPVTEEKPDIWILELPTRTATPIIATPADDYCPRFSPDGQWIAYVSGETGTDEVYVRAYPELQNKVMISNGGGSQPVWSPDGQTLFYRNANRMMAVSIETTPTLKAGVPQMLFNDTFEKELFDNHNYDIHPDGDRFVMIKSSQLMRIDVVENWISELERLISSGE